MLLDKIVDALAMQSNSLAAIWLRKIRKSQNLKKYNSLSDAELVSMNSKIYQILSLWFQKEIERDRIGFFFVNLGKERRRGGFAVSEVTFALMLSQQAVLEYISNEMLAENSLAMYSVINLTGQVADFFFLASYYMMKGYLEDTYIAMNRNDDVPTDVLKKYFMDDFFFKDA